MSSRRVSFVQSTQRSQSFLMAVPSRAPLLAQNRAHRVPAMFEARFQSFDDGERAAGGPRVAALRAELTRRGLNGFLIPRADRHQNEYVPACEERLAWLTGFTGSAGTALVLLDRAVLFTDGRYMLQVREQVDLSIFTIEHSVEKPVATWIEENLPAGTRLGYDPWLFTAEGAEKLAQACERAGATLVATEPDPIDRSEEHTSELQSLRHL